MSNPSSPGCSSWLIVAVLASACSGAAPMAPQPGGSQPRADRAPVGRVVAYVANVVEDRCEPAGCEWRAFDPDASSDELVMVLPGLPSHSFWDEGDSTVYFLAGIGVYRAAWQVGSRPDLLLAVPDSFVTAPNIVDDIWIDEQNGSWHASVISLGGTSSKARVWEHGSSGTWRVLAEADTQCECGDCPCGSVLAPFVRSQRRTGVDELLDRMRVHRYLDVHQPGVQWSEGTHTIPSAFTSGAAIQFDVVFGDSYHAMAPMWYVGRASDTPREIVPKDGPCLFDQLAFEEDSHFLLVVEEFSGSCGRVIDMRTGNITTTLPATTASAVWSTRPARNAVP